MAARTIAEMNVTEIPMPWTHKWGTVVGIEHPQDRPNVVDLVFSNGLKTAETKTATYAQKPNGSWEIARFVRGSKAYKARQAARA